MAPHSSPLAWKIPWMEEAGWLQSMGSHRVGHDWATSLWPRSKRLLISWLQSSSEVILEPKMRKSVTTSTFSLSICHEVMGLDATILAFLIWSEVIQSCLIRWDPMDYSLPASSIHGIFQAKVLEWVAISFTGGSSWTRNGTGVCRITGRHFTIWAPGKPFSWI